MVMVSALNMFANVRYANHPPSMSADRFSLNKSGDPEAGATMLFHSRAGSETGEKGLH